ncbi:hypothetical protein MYX64_03680 [Nitrospinae bacterium AH_259_B05_G02_I21]|nr:hypothetical protein [Nitrospinae bacterium AH_259_B05_G02_I21]
MGARHPPAPVPSAAERPRFESWDEGFSWDRWRLGGGRLEGVPLLKGRLDGRALRGRCGFERREQGAFAAALGRRDGLAQQPLEGGGGGVRLAARPSGVVRLAEALQQRFVHRA